MPGGPPTEPLLAAQLSPPRPRWFRAHLTLKHKREGLWGQEVGGSRGVPRVREDSTEVGGKGRGGKGSSPQAQGRGGLGRVSHQALS